MTETGAAAGGPGGSLRGDGPPGKREDGGPWEAAIYEEGFVMGVNYPLSDW